ncbi:MAG: hypothetical protein QF535_14045 [Anaerolineales bacterium]|nr:hypothetical protein [Anaerolineales bacterium]
MASPQQILPSTPFDGQIFIDAFRVQWAYNAEDSAWHKTGVATDIPTARSDTDVLGPTNGLFSAVDKSFLDSLKTKAGGFGLMLKPGYYLTEEAGADNVLTGDIQIVSQTLAFDCTTSTFPADDTREAALGGVPTVKVELNQNFLESYRLEIKGPQGKKGDTGTTGLDGRPGTGDGPTGDAGDDGDDAISHTFTGIIYEELDEIFDTAVVGLSLDASNGILEITKAKIDVPDNDKAASRVAASPVLRDIEFLSTDLSDWQLVGGADDSVTIDLNVVKLPKGWVGDVDNNPVPVGSVKLSQLVGTLVDHYALEAAKVVTQWDTVLNEWAIARDKDARDVLLGLATQLAECEFQLPIEICIGFEASSCYADGRLGRAVFIVFIDEASPIYYPSGDAVYNADHSIYSSLLNQHIGTLFISTLASVWKPARDDDLDVIPTGATPVGFTTRDIPRAGLVLADLIDEYLNLAGGTQPDNIYLIVDNSGSMTTASINPAYGEFVTWLGNNTSANIVEEVFFDERWLSHLNSFINQLALES